MRLVKPRVLASAAAAARSASPSADAICAASQQRRAVRRVAHQLLRLAEADQRPAAVRVLDRAEQLERVGEQLRRLAPERGCRARAAPPAPSTEPPSTCRSPPTASAAPARRRARPTPARTAPRAPARLGGACSSVESSRAPRTSVWLISACTKRKRPTRSVDSSSSDAATAASSRSSSSLSVVSDQPREELELERAADHGRKRQHLTRLVPEPLDTAGDHVAHAFRQAQRCRAVDAPPLGRLVVQQPPGLDQAAKHLADEERVAVGLARDLPREHQRVRIQLVPGGRRHHLGHLGRSEALQRDPLDPLDSPQVRQHRAERMILAEVRVAEGDDHLERTGLGGRRPRA